MEELFDGVSSSGGNIVGDNEPQFEIFKLDEIDRRVFFWLIGHENLRKSLTSWLEFICIDYKRRRGISISVQSILRETYMIDSGKNTWKDIDENDQS